tara:strand:+ start:1613 stop:2083 length:471 start_codon:yes stop_codon:yes gene_type:complete
LNKIILLYLFLFGVLLSSNKAVVSEKKYAEVGIASIVEDGDNVIINVYSINQIPIAGVEFDIMPNDLFTIDSLFGGICDNLGFELRSNKKGKLLAFSLKGTEIPKSISKKPQDNILFSAYGKKNKIFFNRVITLNTTLASKLGTRINADVVPYIYK